MRSGAKGWTIDKILCDALCCDGAGLQIGARCSRPWGAVLGNITYYISLRYDMIRLGNYTSCVPCVCVLLRRRLFGSHLIFVDTDRYLECVG